MLRKLVSAAALTLLCASCIKDDPAGESLLANGDMMPAFSVTLNDGSTVSNRTLTGQPSVIIFFDTACGDCQRELPHIQKAYDSLRAEGSDIPFICVAREQKAAEVAEYWTSARLTMPWSAPGSRTVYNEFATLGIPRTYIFDREGKLSYQYGPETELSPTLIVSAIHSLTE